MRYNRPDALNELHQAEAGDPVAWVFHEAQESHQVFDVRGVQELEPAKFDERDISPRQLDFERSAVVRRAEQHCLLL